MSVTGTEEPTKVGVPIADLLAGMNGAYGVVAALLERERTGRGRVVRTSLLAGVVGVHAYQGTRWTVGHEVPGLSGSHHAAIAPYGMYRTATAPVQVACGSEGLWRALAGALGLDPDDDRFRTNLDRVTHREQLTEGDRGGPPHRGGRALAAAAGRRRRPGRQGPRDRRRLRVGADAVPAPARRGGAPRPRRRRAARLAAAVRRQRLLRRAPAAPPATRARAARRRDPGLVGGRRTGRLETARGPPGPPSGRGYREA